MPRALKQAEGEMSSVQPVTCQNWQEFNQEGGGGGRVTLLIEVHCLARLCTRALVTQRRSLSAAAAVTAHSAR